MRAGALRQGELCGYLLLRKAGALVDRVEPRAELVVANDVG